MKLSTLALTFAAVALLSAPAMATFDLQITEIYHGHEGSDPTGDWFEVTNFGDMAWVEATDGKLFFDDDSMDTSVADPLEGVSTILPGQSVLFVEDGMASVAPLLDHWNNVPGLVVGYHEGSGLSGNGDGVTLWIGEEAAFPFEGVTNETLLDFEDYPAPTASQDGATFDVALQQYSVAGNLSGAFASAGIGGDAGIPTIGSPGQSAVPEPAAAALALAGFAGLVARRDRQ